MIIEPDLFRDKKCIHVKLNKETHLALKEIFFKKKISFQEAFEEFAQQVISETSSGRKIVESVLEKKKEALLSGRKRIHVARQEKMSSLDVDTLYEVISNSIIEENKRQNGDN